MVNSYFSKKIGLKNDEPQKEGELKQVDGLRKPI